jgi:CubicO group peptidase (beta-lactamase class C family)
MVTKAQTIAQKADELLTNYTNQKRFSGDVLIAVKGSIVFEKAYGLADVATNRPNTLETEFRAGSLTKMFTSTLILQLAEAKKISLDDKVIKYVPDFTGGDKITIKNLLSHTSGIAGSTPQGSKELAEMVKGFKAEPLKFEPGTRFDYNNFNFIMLAYIAQKVSGVEYGKLVKQRIFTKAGMEHSGIDFTGRQSANRAHGYFLNFDTHNWDKADESNVEAASGAGALYTTVGDLYKWSKAIDKHTLLSAASYQQAFTPVQPGYGLGFIVGDHRGHKQISHSGSIPGYMADFIKFPDDDITIIFLSNLENRIDIHLHDALAAIVFNEPYEAQKDKKEVTLTSAQLNKFVGTYDMDGNKMVVTNENGKLMVLAPGGDTAELKPETETKFFVVGPQIGVEFKEENGKVTSMVVDMRGGQKFVRVN